jgi:DNA-binding protein HU-beta
MKKAELVDHVADAVGITKLDATKAVDAVFDGITKSLKGDEEVRISGFGVFKVAQSAGGKARNPRTGEEVDVPPSRRARFTPGKGLKEELNA